MSQTSQTNAYLAGALFVMILVLAFLLVTKPPPPMFSKIPQQEPIAAASVGKTLDYSWPDPNVLFEAYSADQSSNPYWWLDSGAKLYIENGVAATVQGALPKNDPWLASYNDANAKDTDGGTHPQNIFRLVTRSSWGNVSADVSFYIVHDNLSASDQRYESNGLLIMSRYAQGGQTLYYAGVRVDGTAVIKKKYKGTYYTMAQKQVFPGTYDRVKNPNLLPHQSWITLRSDTITDPDGSVTVTLSMKQNDQWMPILFARDDGKTFGQTPPITSQAPVGIRTDFMDVAFGPFSAYSI